MVHVNWPVAIRGWVTPSIPYGSIVVISSVLGAVVMPHNLFLHSEIIQSRQWNLENEKVIENWNQALKQIVDDGTYAKIMQKYE